ncbi:MAG: electron transport complex subunit RsxA [Spirochaetia bacterium]|nr:electron transport complex subunit RsxA [Spirochaetia bacterium]MBO7431116.1 electron transport complex subunit RsxA [Spirochaetia bacterium]
MTFIAIIITYIFINNFILNQFLGMCPFIGVSKDYESAIGMGFAVTFVTSVASLATWCIQHLLLVPFGLTYLQTITFILVIAALVQFVEMVVRKVSPSLYKSLGIFLPLITTNCAVLGIAIIAVGKNYNAIESFVAGMAAGLGFLLAIVLMSCIREKLADTDIPKPFKGVPIAFITASLMALAFMAFDAALLNNLIG